MANNENLIPFNKRTESEQRKIRSAGGKASGESRRRKADMRSTMNRLLTMKVEVEGLSDILRTDGCESTYEEIITMAMIQQAAMGNVKAFHEIKEIVGQTDKSDDELKNLNADTELKQARKQAVTGENETDEALHKLDQILKEARDNAVKQETE
ncbi:MAG: hypothetical protein ACI4E0_04695 [Blautia sp.]